MTDTLAQNVSKCEEYLARLRDVTLGHYIDGAFTKGAVGETYDNVTPVDNSVLGKVVQGTVEDMDAACEAADRAFASWRDTAGTERKKLLHHFADRIVARAEEIALLESIDCGQPIRFMKQAAIRGAANFRFFADKDRCRLRLHQYRRR